jgi:3-deoxy-manno-octulosonate cytidylyltransferase (CMP-KDO synthetase)
MKIVAVIPARYGSTRLEGKPLMDICGKPMIQHVYERVAQAKLIDDVIVATDDQRIVDAVLGFNGNVKLTSIDHKSGTDRVAEAVSGLLADIVVNVQGDEPLIDPLIIEEAIEPLIDDRNLMASTLCHPIIHEQQMHNPNVVKTVLDSAGNALYFSRSLIPYPRNPNMLGVFEHIGIYVFRHAFLMKLVKMPQTPLEMIESLEQLRILENGYRLKVIKIQCEYNGLSVDTMEDLEKVRAILSAGG